MALPNPKGDYLVTICSMSTRVTFGLRFPARWVSCTTGSISDRHGPRSLETLCRSSENHLPHSIFSLCSSFLLTLIPNMSTKSIDERQEVVDQKELEAGINLEEEQSPVVTNKTWVVVFVGRPETKKRCLEVSLTQSDSVYGLRPLILANSSLRRHLWQCRSVSR